MNINNELKMKEILLVEDSPSDADLAIEIFSESQIIRKIYHVENGVEALEFLRGEGKYLQVNLPDLILLDLNLPKKSGIEVLQEIKNDPKLKVIPIIVFTTSSSEDDISLAYLNYANCYLTKPADLIQFTNLVKSLESFWLTSAKLPNITNG